MQACLFLGYLGTTHYNPAYDVSNTESTNDKEAIPMSTIIQSTWHSALQDPTGRRITRPRTSGKTMIIDKGLGIHAFEDLLQTASAHLDMIKIGFGTSPLYPHRLLQQKIQLAKAHNVLIYPGGTFLEVAIAQNVLTSFFQSIRQIGYTGIEVSDGTIELSRKQRNQLIRHSVDEGLTVITEYGKKCWGSKIHLQELIETVTEDVSQGAELVTIEGRESGEGVGIFDEHGACKDEEILEVIQHVPNQQLLLWEAPQKSQQVHLIKLLGADINLGNISVQEILSLEALRRGLRSDTFVFRNN